MPPPYRRTLFYCSGAAFVLFQHVKLVGTDGALFDPQRRSFRPPETLFSTPRDALFEPVDRKITAMPLFPHCDIRVLGSVAGLGAHAPLR